MSRRIASMLLYWLCLPAIAAAQVPSLPTLAPGTRVRVTSSTAPDPVRGEVASMDGVVLTLSADNGREVRLPIGTITAIDTSLGRRRQWLLGLSIGAVTGVLTGLAASVDPNNCGSDAPSFCSRGAAIGGATAFMSGLGVVIGGLTTRERWEPQYRVPTPAAAVVPAKVPMAVPATPVTSPPPATQVVQDAAKPARKNLIALDVLGRGGLFGVTYERNVAPRVGVGVGIGSGFSLEENDPGLIPLYLSWTPVGTKHRVAIGAGMALAHVPASYRDYAVGWQPRIGWSAYPTVGVGYEYRGDSTVWRFSIDVWNQPLGVPGGYLTPRESGLFTLAGFLVGKRF
jgi:hypothetical protein